MPVTTRHRPATQIDIFEPSIALAPYRAFRELRDQGPAIWQPAHEYWAVTRYDDVKAVLQNHQDFISSKGVDYDPGFMEPKLDKQVLSSDPPTHTRLRAVLLDKLAPPKIRALRERVEQQVGVVLDRAIGLGTFDAVTELTQAIPMKVVGDLVGIPEEGRQILLKGADAVFSHFAPPSPHIQERMPHAEAYMNWIEGVARDGGFAPDSWGDALHQAYLRGEIEWDELLSTLSGMLVAGLDTTVNAMSVALRVFAERPEVWEAVKADPTRIRPAIEETLRLASPIVGFFRRAARDAQIGGTRILAGERVLVVYASANHDERHYPDPETFDLDRNPIDHLAMGNGIHTCVGGALARLEATSMVRGLVERVGTIELAGEPVPRYNPVLRGLASLPLTVTANAH